MALKYFLLGLIDLHPSSGYDLVKIFNYSMLFYWHATHTQIYRTLKDLRNDNLITGETVREAEYPPKTIFSITATGKKALDEWLETEPELPGFKHPFLIRLALSGTMDAPVLLKQLKSYQRKLIERMESLQSNEKAGYLSFARNNIERLLWDVSVDNGVTYLKGEVAWVERTVRRVERALEGGEG